MMDCTGQPCTSTTTTDQINDTDQSNDGIESIKSKRRNRCRTHRAEMLSPTDSVLNRISMVLQSDFPTSKPDFKSRSRSRRQRTRTRRIWPIAMAVLLALVVDFGTIFAQGTEIIRNRLNRSRMPPGQDMVPGLEPYRSITREFYRQQSKQQSLVKPFNVILVLPEKESNNDKFGLTTVKVKPVIDIAIEDVIRHRTMPSGWINITYHDSRYWEDTLLAERVSATGVVQAYCERRLDAIFGFADAYSLATASKISAGFGEGVPVLTTTGLTTIIGSKKSYPYVTRMRGSYTQMAEAAYKFLALHDTDDGPAHKGINLKYRHMVFMYHDKRRALNKPSPKGTDAAGQPDESPSSSCYFSLHAIKFHFQEHNEHFLDAWKSQTPHVAFDEELPRTKEDVHQWVKLASMQANGMPTQSVFIEFLFHFELLFIYFFYLRGEFGCAFIVRTFSTLKKISKFRLGNCG